MPILFSGLTTIAGILGLLTHSIIPARQVGVLAATGVTAAMVMSLLMIPALIYIQGRRIKKTRQPVERGSNLFDRLLSGLSEIIINIPGEL